MRASQKGLKMNCIHPFGYHNWTRIIFGKPWFSPVFEPFVVPIWPIFEAFLPLRGAKIAQHGLKMSSKWAHSTCFCTTNGPKVSLQKQIFDPFLTGLWSQNNPFSIHFVTLDWPKWLSMGSNRAHCTCLCTPNGLESCLEKHLFDPCLTHFLVAKQPIFKAFCDFGRAKITCNGLKMGSFHLFRHPKWSRIIFGKMLL